MLINRRPFRRCYAPGLLFSPAAEPAGVARVTGFDMPFPYSSKTITCRPKTEFLKQSLAIFTDRESKTHANPLSRLPDPDFGPRRRRQDRRTRRAGARLDWRCECRHRQ